ncbi:MULTISPECIES: hypothetical protein [Haloferax]|uniref:Uncharacterized protein n=1 Tax=Haloferax marinisediminis TaxID=2666142 RepID=A0A6G1Z5L2_9EURY|nr:MULTISPECIES: hypothetical protein [Haloferax]MRW81822.1 hypothetical protein [Haloferax marinisediminis]
MLGGTLDAMSLFLYGAIALLAAGFWVWAIGSYVYGWTSPGEILERQEN